MAHGKIDADYVEDFISSKLICSFVIFHILFVDIRTYRLVSETVLAFVHYVTMKTYSLYFNA